MLSDCKENGKTPRVILPPTLKLITRTNMCQLRAGRTVNFHGQFGMFPESGYNSPLCEYLAVNTKCFFPP